MEKHIRDFKRGYELEGIEPERIGRRSGVFAGLPNSSAE